MLMRKDDVQSASNWMVASNVLAPRILNTETIMVSICDTKST